MSDNILLLVGIVVAVIAVGGLGIAIFGFALSLKETNRRQRQRDVRDGNYTCPPAPSRIPNRESKPPIVLGDVIEDNSRKYAPDTYVTIEASTSKLAKCPKCYNYIVDESAVFSCPKCGTKYHHDHFFESPVKCVNCNWQPS